MYKILERLKLKILITLCVLMLSSSLTKYSSKNYELSMVCDDHMKALEVRDYDNNRLKKTVLLPNCQNHYTYNVSAIPGSKVILYCFNSAGTAGGGGCIKDSWGTHCLIWKSWEGISINFCNYEYRTIYGTWYYLYKLNQYSCCTTYGFYTSLPNKYVCRDSNVKVVAAYDDHDFELSDYIEYEGVYSWGIYTVFTAGVDYVSYDEGCKQGYKVSTYVAHDLDQDFEFYSKVPGLYSIEWSGYGAWEYYQANYKKCYYHIRVCYHTCGDCDSTTQGDSNNHRCIKCKGSRYFKHGTKNCYSRDEIDDGYHYDENTNEWVNCYKTCGRCSKAGNETNPYCITCSKNFPYLINGGKCVNNTDGYYYENCTGKWVKCHDRCSKCRRGGSDSRHNCDVCAPGYHFVYTLGGQCVKDNEKPEDSYYNETTDTYEKCLDYCSKCTNKTVCNQCRPGYHRIFGYPGLCVPDRNIPEDYYYDEEDDYYKKCYSKCGKCKGPGSETSHNCLKCAPGYHLVYGRPGICISDSEKPDNYYIDNDTDTYKPCHSACGRCYRGGDDYNTHCYTCAPGYYFVFWRTGLCVKPGNHNCTCTIKNDTYVSCYYRCDECDKEGTATDHNCKKCAPGYHFIYNKEGQCILPCEAPDDTYYDKDKDSFEKCYHTCGACYGKGTAENNNCKDCKKVNGVYTHHFIESKHYQCIPESEKPENTYLDNFTNTYRECYKSCKTCDKYGHSVNHNCLSCADGYHFIYSQPGNCILPSEKPDNTYYDEEDDTYKKCYSKCATCNGAGTDSNPNCKTCPRGYYFVYNQTGFCVTEQEKCDRCYLDEDDNTFKPCHERCGKCVKGANSTNMNCVECLKFENGKFKYHFIFNNKGECVGEDQKCSNCYLDEDDNTYKECFSTCATCNKKGSSSAHNCLTCKNGYSFVNGKGSNCLPDDGFDDGYYKENDTWHQCYNTCGKCIKGGNSTHHNCVKCAPGYHFIYNQTGVCVSEKPDDCYYDEEEDKFERCYSTCGGCKGKGDANNHRCTICAKYVNGTFQYHFISTVEGQCVEKGNDNQYLDENDNTYKDCYETCGRCSKGGNPSIHNCITCKNGYSFVADKGSNCFSDNENHDGYYKDEDDNTWKKCYETCSTCSGKYSNSCTHCTEGYHFIYNQPGVCVLDKPDDCYYDEEDDTYKKCYETCSSCSRKGDSNNHFCTECARYSNKTFIYHFTYKKEGQCINNKDANEYLDETDNTYKKCYETCATCSKGGNSVNNNCDTCAPGFKFVKDSNNKNCISKTNPDDGYYYEEGEDIIERCYYTCGKCNKGGNSTNHNCLRCKEGYVALVQTSNYILCIKVEEKPEDYYYDNDTDSYKQCYHTCKKCEYGGNADRHLCTECKMNPDGTYAYHFTTAKEGQCVVNGNDNQYLDESDNTFKDCYDTCGTCSRAGNSESHNCNTCKPGYAFINNRGNNCYSDSENHDGYYKDEDDNTWKKCYDTCGKCFQFGNSTNHNCHKCKDGYHFIYNRTGYCVRPADKCENCYLDEDDDTYKPCYEKCGGCSQGGDSTNHHCTFCAKYTNGTFIYYFVEGHSGQCFNRSEINDDYYYEEEENIYRPCYNKCKKCSKGGNDDNHNCDVCVNGYYFVYNKVGYCVSENDKPEDTYFDNTTNTFERCYDRCKSCSIGGNSNNHNCNRCIDGYFFIYNKTGYCVSPSEKPDDCYLENDTYKKCYERCGSCSQSGSSTNHNCLTCKKDGNGKYLYHFVEGREGFCINDAEKESNYYLDEQTNTYRRCYSTCATCSRPGNSLTHNCTTCINDYAFLAGQGSNCFEITEKDGYYKDENGTWSRCYDTCNKCNKGGDSTNHNCLQCIDGYKFYLVNGYVLCVKDKPDNTYLDNDTYRPCFERCNSCSQGGDSNNHNCLECAKNSNGDYLYHFVHNRPGQCIKKEEANPDDYLDTGDNTYYDCYKSCGTCNKDGTSANHNCLTCKSGYHWIYAVKGNCLTENEAKEKYPYTYYNQTTDTFEKCYERCWTCFAWGNIKYHNCLTCREDYHLVYNQTGQCLRPCAKPEDTYLDNETDTYRKCYDTCATCDFGGNSANNNCTECAKDSNGNYLYHFIWSKQGQCVPISQKGDDEYLDESDNTIKKCYNTCGSCTRGGNSQNHNCATCAPGFHWIYNQEGNCVNNSTCGDDTYYDEEEDTYKKCYDKCKKCKGHGDEENHNCAACPSGYHFIFNHTGQCIPDSEVCRRCYIDEEDDTIKECYERCETCVKGGNSNSHFCTECKKENGQYIYHFIYDRPGICISEREKPDDYYYDEDDNTYKPCYARCSRCNKTGTFTNQNCMACKPGFNLDESKNQCLNDEESNQDGKYVEDGKIKDCYSTCRKCSAGGNSNNHNCDECIDGYHFYWKHPKMCIKDQPDHTYLDNTTNTYEECYSSCKSCTIGGNNGKHNCNVCATGYHFIYLIRGNCIPESQKPNNTYYDEETDTYEKCYDKCSRCNKGGNSTTHNCVRCNNNYHFMYNGGSNCFAEHEKCENCYYEESTDTYQKCYDSCRTCFKGGNSTSHNCYTCPPGYHFIYDKPGWCIREGSQPNNTYYNEEDNTYYPCYSRCSTCYGRGSQTNHNCKQCFVYENGTFKYHFTIDKEHQCISEYEKEHDYYLDNNTNTYEQCHKNCYYCSRAGTDENNNCDRCNPYYHFIYNKTGQCIPENQKPEDTYYNPETDTFEKCYDTCRRCSGKGTPSNPKCTKCATGYHFIYNQSGVCIREGTQPEDTYLDENTDTYRKCHYRCGKCSRYGSDQCSKCANGYHFVFFKPGYCITEEEKCINCYLDNTTDTYEKCYDTCYTCSTGGNSNNHNCNTCPNGYYKIFGSNNCYHINEIPNDYYYEEQCGCFKKCHSNCAYCSGPGTDSSNNCKKCVNGFYFIYNKEGHCIKEGTQPDHTYLDRDTYRLCYERCDTCYGYGYAGYHNCKTCAKDNTGKYIYHFTWNIYPYICISESERPERSYLDESDNTYKKCHNYCLECNQAGTDSANHCTKCINTRHFVYNKVAQGNCIRPSEAPNNTYLNTDNDTYLLCHSSCYYCSKPGDDNNNNCDLCKDGYHFIYNHVGQCIREGTQPNNTYLDRCNDMYKKCYDTCATCVTMGTSEYNNCKKCAVDSNGNYLYHFIYNKPEQCIPESERPPNTYYERETNTYKKCYSYCATCSKGPNEQTPNCDTCINGYHLIEGWEGMCIRESEKPDNYYYDEEANKYRKCYDTCYKCNRGGDATNHNCARCASGYFFIFDRPGICIKAGTQPENYYLDYDTYKPCYETCGTCSRGGTPSSHNCNTCLKNNDGTFRYHFIFNRPGQCVGEDEKCSNCYLDNSTNKYKQCHSLCATCNQAPDEETPHCTSCPPGYAFIYNYPGLCVRRSEKCYNCYIDEEDNTIKKCHETCATCDQGGDNTSPHCTRCPQGYHFIYNVPGLCVTERDKCPNCFLDCDDTYKKCYDTCSRCAVGGNANNHNCLECAKDSNGVYTHHFIYNKPGQCISESEKPNNTVLDEANNTYIRCYETCSKCSQFGDSTNHKCTKCAAGFHFTWEKEGNCVNVRPNNSYYNEEEDKYEKCYSKCSACNGRGNDTNHNCGRCAPGYHFIYNQTGMCVKDKPNDCYYDEEEDMFKKCYSSCGTCDKAGSEGNHNCKTCYVFINGTFAYHFIYTHEGQCVPENEKCTNCYLDDEDNTYKPCYDSCSTCRGRGSLDNHNCYKCAEGYHFVVGFPGLCIHEEECPKKCPKCYLDDDDNTYKQCYERCESCTKEGNSTNHNCKMCKQNSDGSFAYYFIYGQEGQCVSETEKPENYYLDDDNTFKPCYERCASCSRGGDSFTHNCNECAKGSSGYLYHFIYNKFGQCISDQERPNDTYLDNSDNTYKKCYDTCGTCSELGDRNDHKCITCAPGYHFTYDEPGKCVPESKKCPKCYLDEEDNTYKKCYEACSSCSRGGSFDNHNCDACAKASNGSFILHFMFNDTGNCYDDCDMPDGLYLDESDNTFKKCFWKCQNCKALGDDTANKCTECVKNDAGDYLYALVFNQSGQCIDFGTAPAGMTYNNRTNTYEKCHKRCGSCYGEGTDEENKCTLCAYTQDSTTGEYTFTAHFSFADREKGNCYYDNEKPPQTFLNNETNTFEECYPRCLTCDRAGDDLHNNCTSCILDDENNTYLWWIVDNPGQCLTSGEAPNNTYLNTENNTYLYCYERCGSCTELGDENDNKCTSCARDIINGEFLYHFTEANPTNCITSDLQPPKSYLDKEDNTYKSCYERCESCSAGGNAESMNCDVCKSNYYTISNKPGQCVTKQDAPKNAYFDEANNVFVSCYETCGTCTSTGNAAQNNCTSCLQDETFEYYPLNGKQGQCVNLTIVGDNYYLNNGVYYKCFETCGSCSKAGDANNNNCDDCLKDEDGKYLYHFVSTKPGQCIPESEKPNEFFLNETDNTFTSCPSGWTYTDGACYQLLPLNELVNKLGNSDFVLNLVNQTIENPNENYTFLVTTNTSDIDNYVNKIKELYHISESSNLLIGVVNRLNEDGTANRIVSRVFTEDGSELDIVEFNDDTITVNLPFNGSETLTPELAKYIHDYDNDYDVFDPNNKFYNDYCASFQDQNGHDVTLEDRQKSYYNNYCGNCKYISMNYDTNKISCKCSISGKNLNEVPNFKSSSSNNLAVLKCTNESFKGKHLKNNASFFLVTGCILGQIGLIVSFFMFGYPQLLNRVKNVANPVKNATENKDKNKITFKVDDLKNPGNELEQSDKHSQKTSDSNILSNSQSNFANSISNIQKINEKPENDSPISTYKFAYMVQNTEKTYFAMYWEIFKEEYTLLRCIYRKSIFETYAFNFTFFIMYLTFVLGFNAIFIYHKVMHLMFLEKLSTFQYILSPILACILTQIVLYFPKLWLFDYPMFYSVYKNQKKAGEIHETIKALVEKVKTKAIIYFIVIVGFTLFNLIYLTCFCSIFNGSQGKLYADFLISLLIFLIVNGVISAIIAGLRYYGFHNNNERILKIQKTLKDFFISF